MFVQAAFMGRFHQYNKPEDLPGTNVSLKSFRVERLVCYKCFCRSIYIILSFYFSASSLLIIKICTMSKKIKSLIILSVACTALYAQKDSSSQQLDEVVVTATKTAQKQSTTGKVVTVINKAELEKSQGKTLGQILNDQVGLVVNGSYGTLGSVQRVYTRGAGSGMTLILIDGIPAYDPSDIDNNFDLNFIALSSVERIEICKGAQSTLYGSDAIGGVINIITNKAEIKKAVNVYMNISSGSFGTKKTSGQIYGKINQFSYDAGFSTIKTNGFSSAYDSTGKGNFDNDGMKGDAYHININYQLNKAVTLKAFGRYTQYNAATDSASFGDGKYNIDNRTSVGGFGFTVKKDKLEENGYYQYTTTKRFYDYNPVYTDDFHSISQIAEYYASFKLKGHLYMLAGGNYQFNSMNGFYHDPIYGDSPSPDTAFHQYSVYSSLMYKSDKLNVELGGRYNNHSKYGTNYTYTFNPSYKIDEHFRVFGSIASAFKAPSIYQLFDPYSGYPNLKPEKSVNYELGVQYTTRIVQTRLVAFYRDIKDGIDYNYSTYAYFNYNTQKSKGIEYEVTIHPTSKLNITGNYTYIAAQESKLSSATQKDTTYDYSLKIPAHTFNLMATYNFGKHLAVRGGVKYVSSRIDFGGYKLSDYTLFNAYAEYKLGNMIKFFIDIQNLGNTQFFETRGYNAIPRCDIAGIIIKL